jgi:hypothetical protein
MSKREQACFYCNEILGALQLERWFVMAESATSHELIRPDQVELDLWHEVKRTGAIFRASLNGNRPAAAREFQEALRVFNYFIVEHQLPKS